MPVIIAINFHSRSVIGVLFAMSGVSLVAAVWCGYIGAQKSSIRFQQTSGFMSLEYMILLFPLVIFGTISGCSWILTAFAPYMEVSASVGGLLKGLFMTGFLCGGLVLPFGLVSCVLFRGYYFLYFLAQLVFIASVLLVPFDNLPPPVYVGL